MSEVGVAIVGYGVSGRFFHAPLIAATPGLELVTVVTANAARRRQVAAEHPGVRTVDTVEDLWSRPAPGLVVVATPNDSHASLAAAAIERGIAVLVDKPLAVKADAAEALLDRADRAGVMMTVFQNRRWDTDQLTLRRLMAEGALGKVVRYESRFERWRPELDPAKWRETARPEDGGGVLLDLGSHLVDQALTLFGPVTHVYAEIDSRRGAPGDDDAFLALRHTGGTVSHLHASAVTPSPGPRLRVQGTAAGFIVPALDPQEEALRAGARPDRGAEWGAPREWERGRLVAGDQSIPVVPDPGDWPRFYVLLREALVSGGAPPVDPRDAVQTLRILEAARRASRAGSVVEL
jgi:scyllo-inositol 2-dehydrogenase (NADP+)